VSRFLTDSWSGGRLDSAATPKHLKRTVILHGGPEDRLLSFVSFVVSYFSDNPTELVVRIFKDGETSLTYPGRGLVRISHAPPELKHGGDITGPWPLVRSVTPLLTYLSLRCVPRVIASGPYMAT
jgi:hypothetical protein